MPTKAEQDAEAAARAKTGVDPGETANAIDVVDDGAPGAEGSPPARAAETDPPAPPAPPAKSPFNSKRDDIVSRFRTQRSEEAQDDKDEISDFARSGMPKDFEQAASGEEPPVADAAGEQSGTQPGEELDEEPPAAPLPKTIRVKVRGQEQELPLDTIIAEAQKSLAGESYLSEAKAKLDEVDRRLRTTPAHTSQAEQHPARTNGEQPADPASGDPADPQHPADPVQELIEKIQFGDPAQAGQLLKNTISEETTKAVQNVLADQRLRDEGARTGKVLKDFEDKHPDIAKDEMARAAIESRVFNLQLEDIKALGIDPATLRTDGLPPTPGDIASAHRWYRANGYKVSAPSEMLEKATNAFLEWKGVKPTEPAAPARRAEPRVDVTVDRTARRQAIPQQPSRTAAPRQAASPQQTSQPRDRSSIVQAMTARRNAPRGKVALN